MRPTDLLDVHLACSAHHLTYGGWEVSRELLLVLLLLVPVLNVTLLRIVIVLSPRPASCLHEVVIGSIWLGKLLVHAWITVNAASIHAVHRGEAIIKDLLRITTSAIVTDHGSVTSVWVARHAGDAWTKTVRGLSPNPVVPCIARSIEVAVASTAIVGARDGGRAHVAHFSSGTAIHIHSAYWSALILSATLHVLLL